MRLHLIPSIRTAVGKPSILPPAPQPSQTASVLLLEWDLISRSSLHPSVKDETRHRASTQGTLTNEGTGKQALDPDTARPSGATAPPLSPHSTSTNGATPVPGSLDQDADTGSRSPPAPSTSCQLPGGPWTLPRDPASQVPEPSPHCHHAPHASPWVRRSHGAPAGQARFGRPALQHLPFQGTWQCLGLTALWSLFQCPGKALIIGTICMPQDRPKGPRGHLVLLSKPSPALQPTCSSTSSR